MGEGDKREPRRFGMYSVQKLLGTGGMGRVYKARHALLRRPAAVKVLSPELATELGRKRFEREVQLCAQLTHPNTVSIFDYGRTRDGTLYYVMEYLDGVDLLRLGRVDGPQSPGRTIRILEQVLGSLGEAHQAGMVHRDVKPSNILLCEHGGMPDVAKVVDFGLVKPTQDVSQSSQQLTGEGMVIGTPKYLAPEVLCAASTADARSDLYSVGLVGYWLLTGKHAFDGSNLGIVYQAQLHDPPPDLDEARGSAVPDDLKAVIVDTLDKNPANRPQRTSELRDALLACRAASDWTEGTARAWWAQARDSGMLESEDAGDDFATTDGEELDVTQS